MKDFGAWKKKNKSADVICVCVCPLIDHGQQTKVSTIISSPFFRIGVPNTLRMV